MTDKEKYDDYLKRREELLKIRNDSYDSFDKTILTLSTGSLALSITFLDKIGAPFNRFTFYTILIFWVCLFFVLIFNVSSFYFAIKNMDEQIDKLDNAYKNNTVDESFSKYRTVTMFCNKATIFLFVMSFLLFIIYVSCIQFNNFNKFNKETKEMNFKKTSGKVELSRPVTQIFQKGKVEAPKAVQMQTSTSTTETNSQNSNSGETANSNNKE